MKVKEYLEHLKVSNDVTFIIAKAEKYENVQSYYPVYKTTPIYKVSEWKNNESGILDYVVLNNKQNPIDWLSGSRWNNQFEAGRLECILAIKQEELYTLYSNKEQADSLEKFIENEINNQN